MVHVTNRPHVHVRLGTLKFCLRHFFAPLSVKPLFRHHYRRPRFNTPPRNPQNIIEFHKEEKNTYFLSSLPVCLLMIASATVFGASV
jgi:hypothetical protein